METTKLPLAQSVHRDLRLVKGVMEIANGLMDNVNTKVCNLLFLIKEPFSHGGLQTRKLRKNPSC